MILCGNTSIIFLFVFLRIIFKKIRKYGVPIRKSGKSQSIKDQLYEKAAALHDEIRKYNEKLEDLLNKDQNPTNSSGNHE